MRQQIETWRRSEIGLPYYDFICSRLSRFARLAAMDVVVNYRFGLLDLIEAHDLIDHVLWSRTIVSIVWVFDYEFPQLLPPMVHYFDWAAARSSARAPARTPANP
jgi:hypothetical protein